MAGNIPVVRYCKVEEIDESTDSDRIKVRLLPEDADKKISDIDYAFPILPKMLHVKPKVGEGVLVLLALTNDGNSQRYYIGPMISQSHRMYKDPFFRGGDSFFRGAYKKFDIALNMKPEAKGVLPHNDDICIVGRKNCDIQIKEDDIRIKAGVKLTNNTNNFNITFNEKNPSYAKFKYHTKPLDGDVYSTATIVSDKINLLSPSKGDVNLTDRDELVTDETLNKIIKDLYKLPYGEKLVEYLQVLTLAFVEHTHNFSMIPPNPAFTAELIAKKATLLDRGDMLSDTIRIN